MDSLFWANLTGLLCFGLNFALWRVFDATATLHATPTKTIKNLLYGLAGAMVLLSMLTLTGLVSKAALPWMTGLFLTVQYATSAWSHVVSNKNRLQMARLRRK